MAEKLTKGSDLEMEALQIFPKTIPYYMVIQKYNKWIFKHILNEKKQVILVYNNDKLHQPFILLNSLCFNGSLKEMETLKR